MKPQNQARIFLALFLLFNFFLWVSGFALLLLGVWLTLDQERILLFGLLGPIGSEVDALWTLALALLGLGVVVVFTGAFGCCGSIRRSKCILCLYIFVVLMVLASEVALAILSILFHGRVNRFVDESSEDNIVFRRLEVDYGRESRFTTIMDLAQYKFMCCGINGYEDYERTAWRLEYLGGSSLRVPLTCCVMRKSSKTSFLNPTPVNQTSCQSELQHRFLYDRYTEGCLTHILSWLDLEVLIFTGSCFTLALGKAVLVAISICYYRSIPDPSSTAFSS